MSKSYYSMFTGMMSSLLMLDNKNDNEDVLEEQVNDKVQHVKLKTKKDKKIKKRMASIKDFEVGENEVNNEVSLSKDNRALRLSETEENKIFFNLKNNGKQELSKQDSKEDLDSLVQDDLLTKLEAIKLETGDNWLKVYNESLGTVKPIKKKVIKGLEFDKVQNNFEYLNPQASLEETIKEEVESNEKEPSIKSPSTKEKGDEINEPEEEIKREEVKKLPEGPSFQVIVETIDLSKLDSPIPKYTQKNQVLWIFSIEEINVCNTNEEIIDTINVNEITKVLILEYKSNAVRIELKSSEYSYPTMLDVCFEKSKFNEVLVLLIEILKNNLIHIPNLYRQSKCLKCGNISYVGENTSILEEQTSIPNGLTLPHVKLKYFKNMKCKSCHHNLLIEFYGPNPPQNEIHDKTLSKSPKNVLSSLTQLATNTKPYFNNLFNLNHIKSEPTSPKEISNNSDTDELTKKLPNYQPNLVPLQSLNNSLRLHLDLNLLDVDNNEVPLSWISANYLMMPNPFVLLTSNWLFNNSNNLEQYSSRSSEIPIYLLLSNFCLYLFTPNLQCKDNNDLADYLIMNYKIEFDKIEHIDIGYNRQSITLHNKVYDANTKDKKDYDKNKSEILPSHSITIMIRDKNKSTQFLDELLPILYEKNIRKRVNHDILWTIFNLRKHIFLKPNSKCIKIINKKRICLDNSYFDSASLDDVIVDKVTFDFIKFMAAVYLFKVIDDKVQLVPITLILTKEYIYLCEERNDIWPPPIKQLLELNELDNKISDKLLCNHINQFNYLEAIKVDTLHKIDHKNIKFCCQLLTNDALSNANVTNYFKLEAKPIIEHITPHNLPLPESDDEVEDLCWNIFFNSKQDGSEFLNCLKELNGNL